MMMAFVMFTSMVANAQNTMRVELTNGSTSEYNIQHIDTVLFDKQNDQDFMYVKLTNGTNQPFMVNDIEGVSMVELTMEELVAQLQDEGFVKLNLQYEQFHFDVPLFASPDGKRIAFVQVNTETGVNEICYYSTEANSDGNLFEEPYTIWYSNKEESLDALSSWGYDTLFSMDKVMVCNRMGSEMCSVYLFEEDELTWTIIPFISTVASNDDVCNYLTTELGYKPRHMGDWTYYQTGDRNTVAFVLSTTINEVELTFVVYTSKTNAVDFYSQICDK